MHFCVRYREEANNDGENLPTYLLYHGVFGFQCPSVLSSGYGKPFYKTKVLVAAVTSPDHHLVNWHKDAERIQVSFAENSQFVEICSEIAGCIHNSSGVRHFREVYALPSGIEVVSESSEFCKTEQTTSRPNPTGSKASVHLAHMVRSRVWQSYKHWEQLPDIAELIRLLSVVDQSQIEISGSPGAVRHLVSVLCRYLAACSDQEVELRLAARNSSSNLSGKLHRVEMSPGAIWSCVGTRPRLGTLGAAKLTASMLQIHGDSVGGKVEIGFHNVPVIAEAEKLSIMGVEIVHLHRIQNHRRSDDLPLNSPKNQNIKPTPSITTIAGSPLAFALGQSKRRFRNRSDAACTVNSAQDCWAGGPGPGAITAQHRSLTHRGYLLEKIACRLITGL
jgi:hypothetical protein